MAFRALHSGDYATLPTSVRLRAPLLLIALQGLRRPEQVAELVTVLSKVRGVAGQGVVRKMVRKIVKSQKGAHHAHHDDDCAAIGSVSGIG